MYKVVYNACYGGFGLSRDALIYLRDKYQLEISANGDYLVNDIDRHDPRLVDVVETLGGKVNDMCSNLVVAVIESPVYRIDEYDGFESVETPDSYEWVVIK